MQMCCKANRESFLRFYAIERELPCLYRRSVFCVVFIQNCKQECCFTPDVSSNARNDTRRRYKAFRRRNLHAYNEMFGYISGVKIIFLSFGF